MTFVSQFGILCGFVLKRILREQTFWPTGTAGMFDTENMYGIPVRPLLILIFCPSSITVYMIPPPLAHVYQYTVHYAYFANRQCSNTTRHSETSQFNYEIIASQKESLLWDCIDDCSIFRIPLSPQPTQSNNVKFIERKFKQCYIH